MSFVERVNQSESLASWLNWLTDSPAVCWSVIMGGLSASWKGVTGPFQRPSERVQEAVLCTAWTNHYLNQGWPSSLMHICTNQPQWVNSLKPKQNDTHSTNYRNPNSFSLTHWAWVMHMHMRHLPSPSLVQITACRHCLKQCCIVVNWTLSNKLQSNCIQNSNIFIPENTFEIIVRKMSSMLRRLNVFMKIPKFRRNFYWNVSSCAGYNWCLVNIGSVNGLMK